MAARVGFHHGLTVFEMIFYAAELEIDLFLQFFGKGRKGFILQAVRNLPTQICVGQIFPCGYKIRLYGIIITPQDLFQCAALRPIQAFDDQLQKRRHYAARTFSDLCKLPAVKENVSNGQLCAY